MFLIFSTNSVAQQKLQEGYWHAELQLNDTTPLPFVFEVKEGIPTIINGEERIRIDELSYIGDSLFLKMPVYETEIRCKLSENRLDGYYINHTRITKTTIPFLAIQGMGWRFSDRPERTSHNLSGRWLVRWDKEEGENKLSVALFEQEGNRVTGTFLTPTGDYRFLEGEMGGATLRLSAFDASHAYLFDAIVQDDGSLRGNFFSGSHWHDNWTAHRDSEAELIDPESMVFLKPSFKTLAFSLADEKGKNISLKDPEYLNKVVIVQLMGTWCSNCLDETIFYVELSKKYSADKFKIIALDFEKTDDPVRIARNIHRIKERLSIEYPILYAGNASKEEAIKTLPMLSRIAAYPTTIVIDKKGMVRKIHTGFNGPASGTLYEKHVREFSGFLERLMDE